MESFILAWYRDKKKKFDDKDALTWQRLHISQLPRRKEKEREIPSVVPFVRLFVFSQHDPCPSRFEYRNVLKLFPLRETACRYHRTYATETTVYVITTGRILDNYFTGNTMIRANLRWGISFRSRNRQKKRKEKKEKKTNTDRYIIVGMLHPLSFIAINE